MWWIFIVILQVVLVGASIRDEQREGLWNWPRFFWLLGFAALECVILFVPIYLIHDVHNSYFIPVYVAAWVVAALNFVWMIRVARRWKLPLPKANRR